MGARLQRPDLRLKVSLLVTPRDPTHLIAWKTSAEVPGASADCAPMVLSPPLMYGAVNLVPWARFTPLGQAFPVWAELAEELGAEDPGVVISSEFASVDGEGFRRMVLVGRLDGRSVSIKEEFDPVFGEEYDRTKNQLLGSSCMFTASPAEPLSERLTAAGGRPAQVVADRLPSARVGLPPSFPFVAAVMGGEPVTGVAWVSEFGDLAVAVGSTSSVAFMAASDDPDSAMDAAWSAAPGEADDLMRGLMVTLRFSDAHSLALA